MAVTTAPGLLERVAEIRPLVEAEAEEGERLGELTAPVVKALHELDAFAMWVPRSVGGLELSPVPSLDVIEALSHADASTGWVVMAGALSTGTGAAYLGDEAVERIFGAGRDVVIAGQGTRPERAVPVEGGYRVTGSWSFASGVKHAGWIHTGAVVQGAGEPRICVVRVEDATLLPDTWDVLGLRATGSIDYTIDDLYVAGAFTHPTAAAWSPRGGPLFFLGIANFAMLGHSAWALGVGRRMLDELRASLQRTGRPSATASSDHFQIGFAEAEAQLRAARALVHETWTGIEETLARGDAPSVRERTLARLGLNHATWTVEAISSWVYRSGGTAALRRGVLQRCFRDVHAGTQHATSGQAVLRECGRELAGLAPGKVWRRFELVDPA
jgi:indole-3-acetate monooxygenase